MAAKLVAVRLSSNTEAVVSEGVNGGIGANTQVNSTANGRNYVVLEFVDTENLFKFSRATRTYWMNENGSWAGATPAELFKHVGKEVPGAFVTLPVAAYKINDADEREVNSYTTFVMPHEDKNAVFTRAGHTVLNAQGEVIAEASGTKAGIATAE